MFTSKTQLNLSELLLQMTLLLNCRYCSWYYYVNDGCKVHTSLIHHAAFYITVLHRPSTFPQWYTETSLSVDRELSKRIFCCIIIQFFFDIIIVLMIGFLTLPLFDYMLAAGNLIGFASCACAHYQLPVQALTEALPILYWPSSLIILQ